jgi:hypothetical protein
MPGTGGAFTASTGAVPVPSMGTAPEVGPLTSSSPSRGQNLGGALRRAAYAPGALWRAAYAPGGGQTSPAYSIHSLQYLYINQILPANKPVLLYLLLCLLPHQLPVLVLFINFPPKTQTLCDVIEIFIHQDFYKKYWNYLMFHSLDTEKFKIIKCFILWREAGRRV